MINVGEHVEEGESLSTVDGSINWLSNCGKQYGGSSKS